jgi:hypothetical protein
MSSEDRPNKLGNRIELFLRRRHPSKTVANVAAETGCTTHQVGKWLEGASAPNGAAMTALIAAYGPEFLAAVMPDAPAWLDAALQAERRAQIDAKIAQRRREIEELTSARR